MAIVDSLSAPATNTLFDANADCHIILVWTNEDSNNAFVNLRYAGGSSMVVVACRGDGTNNLVLQYNDGSWNTVVTVTQVFTADIEYKVDIYANGTNIKVDVDDVEQINETLSYNETQTGGRVQHTLDTNDIELESWPYGEPAAGVEVTPGLGTLTVTGHDPVVTASTGVAPSLGTLMITGYDPVVTAASAWEVGAYIYTTVGGVDVNAKLGTLMITGYDPVVSAPTGVAPGLGTLTITGHDPVVQFDEGLDPTLGTLTVTGHDPVVKVDAGLNPTLGTLTVAGHDPVVKVDASLDPTLGIIEITGHNPNVNAAIAVAAGLGTLTVVGYDPVVTAGVSASEHYGLTSNIKLTAAMDSDILLTLAMDSDLHLTQALTCTIDLEEVS